MTTWIFIPTYFSPLLLILVIALIIYWRLIYREKRIYDLFRQQGINGEPFVPLIGQLPTMRRYRRDDAVMQYHQDLAKKHGHLFVFCFGPITRIVIMEPDLLADILNRANAQNYQKPPIFSTVFTPIIGHQNLLVSEGQEHERGRRMINPAFHHTSLKAMISIITNQTSKTIDELLLQSLENRSKPIDLQFQLNALTLAVIACSAFGSGFETITNAKEIVCKTFGEVLEAVVDRSLLMINQIPIISTLPFWKKDVVDRGAQIISHLVDRIIAERRQGLSSSLSDGPDLLDLLLSAVDDDGKPFTDQQAKEQALTFVLAGSETTGNLMAWIFSVFMAHPEILKACQDEVDRILPNGNEPTYEDLNQLVVCEAIINETLRLYPPAPLFTRYSIRDHVVGQERRVFIPAGATVAVNTYILHRRPDLWPRPEEFDYTRWLRDPKTGMKPKLPHPFAYLPFAAGPRNCIGQNFALLEAKILLAMFVQRCEFDFVPGQKIVPDFKVTMRPKYGVLAYLTPRPH